MAKFSSRLQHKIFTLRKCHVKHNYEKGLLSATCYAVFFYPSFVWIKKPYGFMSDANKIIQSL